MKTPLDIWRQNDFNPWRELTSLQRRMDRLFDEFLSPASSRSERGIDFVPSCDLEETDASYVVSLDVPGMSRNDLQIEVTGNTLTVSGEKREEKKEGKGARRLYERYHGRFERSFLLPETTDAEQAQASFKDGVLQITIPKSAKAHAKRIQIGEAKPAAAAEQTTGKKDEPKQPGRAA